MHMLLGVPDNFCITHWDRSWIMVVIEASCGSKGCDTALAPKDKYGNPMHPAFLQVRHDEKFQAFLKTVIGQPTKA